MHRVRKTNYFYFDNTRLDLADEDFEYFKQLLIDNNIDELCQEMCNKNKVDCFISYLVVIDDLDNFILITDRTDTYIHSNECRYFRMAVYNNSYDIAKYLLENGANVHVCNSYAITCASGFGKFYVFHSEKKEKRDTVELVKLLIDYNAMVGTDTCNLVHTAIDANRLDVVKILVENGADIFSNQSKLLKSAVMYNYDILEYLISQGIDVTDDNNSVLKFAVSRGYDCVDLLLDAGADMNTLRREDVSKAILMKGSEIIETLNNNGYDFECLNGFSNTIIDTHTSKIINILNNRVSMTDVASILLYNSKYDDNYRK
ncbi:putative ankyrin repeat protein [Acanthamoeba castellanii mimivirus]|uniref:Putative ankyrin repeat protein R600 n=5 Tax=Mimivirus TaxID=315393 RepID=YR600_MIMIV|nr:putative ankyrin repeat protein [Acanthamoeba polyphaga mimivirus]Q5UP63.1 RecName: Full=Putative ankyrin repeat protein R600 [Acanthamoeba polyphaga mimivirus]AHA45245.1 putative ankyrin repeat protein [Hirudovirus strain Sangsue]AHJ40238.1 ankyrin repeat protein [Samba virus]ALR84188.1 ankyrin repeat protein [Niemeyer virus]AMZ03043.1 putative ankyrin repeat protein [Mimivirus Bombay]BAV61715.1 putative ankyrin repeat protein [Acanthamoeba castellanii mimivirus]